MCDGNHVLAIRLMKWCSSSTFGTHQVGAFVLGCGVGVHKNSDKDVEKHHARREDPRDEVYHAHEGIQIRQILVANRGSEVEVAQKRLEEHHHRVAERVEIAVLPAKDDVRYHREPGEDDQENNEEVVQIGLHSISV